ncbi:MAG: hypothetical protein MJZ79_05860 [Paludibacteraceae bacterium]|nr:hypothetical protein [Paludibacteraceae bacterium]
MSSKLETTTPMPLNKFGELLLRCKYQKTALRGRHGYIVKVIENQVDRQIQDIHEIITGASGASTF